MRRPPRSVPSAKRSSTSSMKPASGTCPGRRTRRILGADESQGAAQVVRFSRRFDTNAAGMIGDEAETRLFWTGEDHIADEAAHRCADQSGQRPHDRLGCHQGTVRCLNRFAENNDRQHPPRLKRTLRRNKTRSSTAIDGTPLVLYLF